MLNVVGYVVGLGLPHHLDKSIVSVRSGACAESEDISVTVVVDDEVDGACMRIEGELVDVEVDEQSNEVWGSVTGEVGVRIVVRESRRGCSSSLDALRFFDVMVSCLVGWLSSSLPLSLPPLGVLSITVV